jgi:glucosamine-6-phosphate deaminase
LLQPNTQTEPTYEPYSTLSMRVAEQVKNQLIRKPDSVFGCPTGRTPTGAYRILARWSKEGEIDWSKAKCFGLDEYIDVEEAGSFRHYLEQNLYKFTNLRPGGRFSPFFTDDYDGLIATNGGLDLTILGIGTNGHIAFNEPGTPLESFTHSIWLTESTRQANAEFFGGLEKTPTRAVTMGIRTILSSRRIILMVSGKQKKGILTKALEGPVTTDVPASFLQLHRAVSVMTDFDL